MMPVRIQAKPVTAQPVVCNGCLVLLDPAWEPVVRVGDFAFHQQCQPVCCVCGGPLAHGVNGAARDFYVLKSHVEFMSARGYQVKLVVCCCDECYDRALHDDPAALA